jgi:ABC-2 type transport system permease protein
VKAFFQLYLSNLREFVRDRMAMFWTLAFPIIFIVLFGIIFSGNGNTSFSVGVANEDTGPMGAAIAKAFASVDAFKVTDGSRADLTTQLDKGDLNVLIVIPEGVSGALTSGKPDALQVFYDPSNQTTSQIVLTIVEKVVSGFDQAITQRPTLLSVTPETVTSSSLRTIDFLLPGILAMSLMQLGLFATAPALVQLREQQVLRRIGATPLPRTTLLAAQVAHRLTIGLSQTLVIIVVGTLAFNVHMIGNWAVLAGVVLLGSFMFVALGYLISGLAKTQESVVGISQLINFPMMFLSGLFFPVSIMPDWIRPVVSAMPLTYLADMLRQIMVGATPTYPAMVCLAVVAGWLVVCSVLAVRLFRWE